MSGMAADNRVPVRVLLIDDDDRLRRSIRRMLEEYGFDVMEAASGAIGLSMMRFNRFDLVITDLFMPDIEGIGIVLECHFAQPAAKIIAISCCGRNPDIDYLDLAVKLGAHRVVEKPFRDNDLMSAVQGLMQ